MPIVYLEGIVCIIAQGHKYRVPPSVTRIAPYKLSQYLPPSLPRVFCHALATWILSGDEANLVCKPSLSETKALLKPVSEGLNGYEEATVKSSLNVSHFFHDEDFMITTSDVVFLLKRQSSKPIS